IGRASPLEAVRRVRPRGDPRRNRDRAHAAATRSAPRTTTGATMSAEAGTVPLERERRLVLAILEEAVRSYQHYAFATNRRGRRLFGETCEWFDSHDNTWIFSFENICYALDLDPEHIRK